MFVDSSLWAGAVEVSILNREAAAKKANGPRIAIRLDRLRQSAARRHLSKIDLLDEYFPVVARYRKRILPRGDRQQMKLAEVVGDRFDGTFIIEQSDGAADLRRA
jgi:hypothetical protein